MISNLKLKSTMLRLKKI